MALHWGGPVAPGRGFVLHGGGYASRSTVPVAGGVAFSVDEAAVSDFLFDRDPETMWEEALARVEVDL